MVRVFVPGVFDVFHIGHLNYLKNASSAGDYLIVGIQDDREVRKCKGIAPVIPLHERMAIIENLRFVDEVVSYMSAFQGPLLTGLGIDVLAVGEEYGNNEQFPEQKTTLAFCEENDVGVHRIPRTNEVSSTKIRAQLKSFWQSRAQMADDLPSGVTVLGTHNGNQNKVSEQTAHEIQLIMGSVENPQEKTLLDLGCGDGRQLIELCRSFGESTGVDYAGELLNLAGRRAQQESLPLDLVEADAVAYRGTKPVDVLVLSGLLPCIDDLQFAQLLRNLDTHSKPGTQLFVRTSIGTEKRLNVINQFSTDLNSYYTAYYRTEDEVIDTFTKRGWQLEKTEALYQHREDTRVAWYEFRYMPHAEQELRRAA